MLRYANHPSEWVGYHQFPGQTGSFEVFHSGTSTVAGPVDDHDAKEPGWYWWACFPGCLPDGDGDPSGPFQTAKAAYNDAMGE